MRLPYAEFAKPGVRLLKETVLAIDPAQRRVSTDAGTHEADLLVVALGADYDIDATPGLAEAGNEFYSVAGAERLAGRCPEVRRGPGDRRRLRRALQVPAGAERGGAPARTTTWPRRASASSCEITFVMPLGSPVPPSPETSEALLAAFAERDIAFLPGKRIQALDPERRVTVLDDGTELPFDLFLGVPKHRAPDVVIESGMTEDGYMPVDSRTLATSFPGVYAVGDVATVGVPKAGVFAEGAGEGAGRVADRRAARRRAAGAGYRGQGSCYIEFGAGRVGRVDVDFLSGPKPTGTFHAPSGELVAEKEDFGASRAARWFGR